eukprot:COSAG01_NODE_9789_length_2343_cov_3.490642_2_plen_104_part_00
MPGALSSYRGRPGRQAACCCTARLATRWLTRCCLQQSWQQSDSRQERRSRPTGIFLLRFSRILQSTNLCFGVEPAPAAAAAADFCGGLLNRLAGSRWVGPYTE